MKKRHTLNSLIKILSILLVLMCIFCIFVACDDDTDNNDTDDTNNNDGGSNNGTYTVTFNSDGAGTIASQSIASGKKATEPTTPTKSGYAFDGWYNGSEKWIFSQYTVTENVTLKAKWTLETYTITYEYEEYDHTITIPNNSTPTTYTAESQDITLPTPQDTVSCKFLGWYDENNTKITKILKSSAKNKTVTAKFQTLDGLENFDYTATKTDCVITGLKNKTLTEMIIPNGVTMIDVEAFKDSTITSVTLPSSVKTIAKDAFKDCSSIAKVNYLGTIFDWCGITFINYASTPVYYSKNLYINGNLLTSLVIPNSVTSIGDYAFYKCAGITNVTIPNSVTSIGECAFEYCTGLTSVTIPNSVTSIGDYAFEGCTGLTSVTIPNSVTSIGYRAFFECTGIKTLTIGKGVKDIGGWAFYDCSGISKVNFLGTMKDWCNINFEDFTSSPFYSNTAELYMNNELVTRVYIPDTVTEIKQYAFYSIPSITVINIPTSVTSIGTGAFYRSSDINGIIYSGKKAQWENISLGTNWIGKTIQIAYLGEN